MNILIIGCGYVGQKLAQQWVQYGEVIALSHRKQSQSQLQALGIQVLVGDLDVPASLAAALSGIDLSRFVLAYFAPPPRQGQTDPRMAHFLQALQQQSTLPSQILLISTTGTYGDCQGDWIDETQPLNPRVDRARRRVDAEQQLQQWSQQQQVPVSIFRVPGIYGPARLPIKRLQQGLPVLDESIAPYSNRIHVDDLVSACVAVLLQATKQSEIYNICDGTPTTMTDYFNQVADAVGLSRPPSISAELAKTQLSPEMLGYLAESKRIVNHKMCTQLGIQLQYPNLKAGLAACIANTEL
ncbi:SDR family oxidoreductase [Candidatus Venteria ishoeyi]|uniref:NAD dependent epimerase/dehydratase family protein n=1 Tax=Candidatus Venteria ishoeyi TaxID=1899563 RepID=A0A1H6FFS1_9GAMM|nr:SDR family oxidoreductase [Candidatus Venteria ishoeyi]SEH08199.1 NAD dependent epimerase/dehydratase family protein [Candidatus Venteria ishoeyi]